MNTSIALLEGYTPDQIASIMHNRKIAASLVNIHESMKDRWKLVKSELDIIEMIDFYKAMESLYRGCVGEIMAREAIEWIQQNRDKKAATLGTFYK